ncbi:hypothetical protein [Amycolatopsis sp. FDAARGOS 1241]|uniref:hypothetical protein n=1 Tax=Amycolatopsis sp. FDAARGOS 1241 TaxID=2778070 RepID=UPI00194F52FD|nr:hypothetical protein [Amycolatopsis sp. FDAARGOS 1241]QRP44157.1 hypothetical protein I6J71_33395 [Amycolatopsis sp. FDAARGOS 1241]
MAGRVALWLEIAVGCVGVWAAGVNRFEVARAQAVLVHRNDFTVYGDVVRLEGGYFELDYSSPGGRYRTIPGQRPGEYHVPGDRVLVTYDQAAQAVVWYPDDDVLDPDGEAIASGLTLTGVLGLSTAVGFAVRWWRRRHTVRRTGWRPARFDFREPGVARATFADGSRLWLWPVLGLSRAYARVGSGRGGASSPRGHPHGAARPRVRPGRRAGRGHASRGRGRP